MRNLLVIVDSFIFNEKHFFDLKSVVMENCVGGEFKNVYYLFFPGMREHLMKLKNDYNFNRLIYNSLIGIMHRYKISNLHLIKYDHFANSVSRAILEEMMANYIHLLQLVEVDFNLARINYSIMNPPFEKATSSKKYLFGVIDFVAFNNNPLEIFKRIKKDHATADNYYLTILPNPSEFINYEKKFSTQIPGFSFRDDITKIGINIDKSKLNIFNQIKYRLLNI